MLSKNLSTQINDATRLENPIPNPMSFQSDASRRVSYQQRLYFENASLTKYSKPSQYGQAFFVTFTYNDNAIPTCANRGIDLSSLNQHYDDLCSYVETHARSKGVIDSFYKLCVNRFTRHVRTDFALFDYADFRHIYKYIQKRLSIDYHSQLRYFLACESGEGGASHGYIGKRGLGNNPHYHVIFFVSPQRKKNNTFDKKYKKISSESFLELCRQSWQYRWDESKQRFIHCDYKTAAKGHVEPGQNNGLLNSSDALGYVAKYVTKDNSEQAVDLLFRYFAKLQTNSLTRFDRDSLEAFFFYEIHNTCPTSSLPSYDYNKGKYTMPSTCMVKEMFSLHSIHEYLTLLGYPKYMEYKAYQRRHPNGHCLVKCGNVTYYDNVTLPADRFSRNLPLDKYCSFGEFISLTHCMDKSTYFKYVSFFKHQFVAVDERNSYLACYNRIYGNRYSAKYRCSKSLGEYGVKKMKHTGDGTYQVTLYSSHSVDTARACAYLSDKKNYLRFFNPLSQKYERELSSVGQLNKVLQIPSHVEDVAQDCTFALSCVRSSSVSDITHAYLPYVVGFYDSIPTEKLPNIELKERLHETPHVFASECLSLLNVYQRFSDEHDFYNLTSAYMHALLSDYGNPTLADCKMLFDYVKETNTSSYSFRYASLIYAVYTSYYMYRWLPNVYSWNIDNILPFDINTSAIEMESHFNRCKESLLSAVSSDMDIILSLDKEYVISGLSGYLKEHKMRYNETFIDAKNHPLFAAYAKEIKCIDLLLKSYRNFISMRCNIDFDKKSKIRKAYNSANYNSIL